MSRSMASNYRFRRGDHSWRVQSADNGDFDEIVVRKGKATKRVRGESGLVLHAEAMSSRSWFVDVAGICLWIHTGRDGIARISWAEDRRPVWPIDLTVLRDPTLQAEDGATG